MQRVRVIGAGLAGAEAAWQCARRGVAVELFEMRPVRSTPAHQTADFAELVCSNSLKSESENTAPWLLKEELRRAGSLLLEIARECAVPAGHALAVDRTAFAAKVTEAISKEPLITVRREEVTGVDEARITIIATGPLTSDGLAVEIARLSDGDNVSRAGAPAPQNHNNTDHHLYFYDSISPIVEADSIDMTKVYLAARYDKGSADYINCPMSREEYDRFYDGLVAAQSVEEKDWEKLNYFESCLPIEEIARRGRDTLRFGPMKPVGLKDPKTGRIPYAAVQLRQENLRADSYNLVGLSKSLEIWRAGARVAADSGTGKCAIFEIWANPSQYLHQFAGAVESDAADERASAGFVCGTNLRGGRICGIDCHWADGWHARSGAGGGDGTSSAAAGERVRIAGELCGACRREEVPTGQHNI